MARLAPAALLLLLGVALAGQATAQALVPAAAPALGIAALAPALAPAVASAPALAPVLAPAPGPAGAAGAACTTAYEVLVSNSSYATALLLVRAANLAGTLDDPTLAFTLFAPTNAAITARLQALSLSTNVLTANPQLLGNILQYHIIPRPLRAAQLVDGATYDTLLPDETLRVSVSGGVTKLNGARTSAMLVSNATTACSAYVYGISDILLPQQLATGRRL